MWLRPVRQVIRTRFVFVGVIQKIKTPNGKEFILMHLPYYLGIKLYEYIENLVKKHP